MPDNTYSEQTENRDDRLFEAVQPRISDITDPPQDQKKLKSDEATINLPEVWDIPGQEHVHVPEIIEMEDTTASSADEEGEGVLDALNTRTEEEVVVRKGTESDVPAADREVLKQTDDYYPSRDEERLKQATMDNTDFEGTPLNEKGFGRTRTGSDLDVPGAELDDKMEETGSEDEENNYYTLGGEG